MKIFVVSEGNTGILYLTDKESGEETIYHPNCDLNLTRDFLYEFYDQITLSGEKVKDSFADGGVDWFPLTVSQLYWQFFFQFIKYQPLIEEWYNNKVNFEFDGVGKFKKLIDSLTASSKRNRICCSCSPLWMIFVFVKYLLSYKQIFQ